MNRNWSNAKCVYCGCPITFSQQHTFQGVCDQRECKKLQLNAWIEKKRLVDRERLEKRRQAAILAYQKSLEGDEATSFKRSGDRTEKQMFAVPAMVRPLTELPANRRAEFVSHLTSIVNKSFQENDELASQADDTEQAFIDQRGTAPLPILSAACGACQGECCRNGGTHAFISTKLIDDVRRVNRDIKPSQLIELYLSYLPDRSFDESCVYHQATGCALPRAMRTDLCNHFECEDLNFIRNQSDASPVVLVALEGNSSVRIVEFDQSVDE